MISELERMFDAIKGLGTRRLALLSILTYEFLVAEVMVMPPL